MSWRHQHYSKVHTDGNLYRHKSELVYLSTGSVGNHKVFQFLSISSLCFNTEEDGFREFCTNEATAVRTNSAQDRI